MMALFFFLEAIRTVNLDDRATNVGLLLFVHEWDGDPTSWNPVAKPGQVACYSALRQLHGGVVVQFRTVRRKTLSITSCSVLISKRMSAICSFVNAKHLSTVKFMAPFPSSIVFFSSRKSCLVDGRLCHLARCTSCLPSSAPPRQGWRRPQGTRFW